MIGQITTGNPLYLNVASNPGYYPQVYDNNDPMQGAMRYVNNQTQIWDGTNWKDVTSGSAYVDLSESTKAILQWAQNKMREENTLSALTQDHPAVAEAMELVRHAEERLKIVVALVKENKHEVV